MTLQCHMDDARWRCGPLASLRTTACRHPSIYTQQEVCASIARLRLDLRALYLSSRPCASRTALLWL